ncbi:MAG: ROK family transcriptional regulator [Chloroflexota bacterium]
MPLPTKATHQRTREHNVRLVLRTLYEFGPISRADIARQTHLTRTTVGDVVTELIDEGMVDEVGRGASSGGKAPILLRINSDARSVIGLDLGEGVFTGALVNLRGETSHPVDHPVDGRDGAEGLAVVESLVDTLRAAATGPVIGIGVGTPGVIDTRTGTIRWAVNLDWQDLPLGRLLEEHTGLPVYVANDSQAAALAEFAFGADGPRVPNQVVIKVGKGVGAGIVLGGRLYQGDGFGAGEIGHLGVVDDGAACRCGRFGCLETVASADAIVRRAGELAAEDRTSILARLPGGPAAITLADVQDAFAADDPAARTAVLEAARALGAGIAAIIGVLDVHRVALHGSVTQFGERWLAAVRDEAVRRSLGLLAGAVSVDLVRLDSNLTVMGASAMLMTAALGLELAR